MVNFDEVMTAYFNECIYEGYSVLDKGVNEIVVSNGEEEVELNLKFTGDKKLNIDFYRNTEATDAFVNKLMTLFSTIVNSETVRV